MEIVGYLSLFMVGLILGTLGGGGSILSVPILVYLFSLDAVMASAYSLFIVGATSFVGSILKYNENMICFTTASVFGFPSLGAIFLTRNWIIPAIPEIIFQLGDFQFTKRGLILGLFAILLVLASLALITKRDDNVRRKKSRYWFIYLIILGLFTGFCTGIVGAGGGFLIIPVLVYFTDLPFNASVGTTLLIITFNSLSGFIGDAINYAVNWPFLLLITCLAVLGIVTASRSTRKVPFPLLRAMFGWLTLFIGILILVREVFLVKHLEYLQ